jgi:hypothetical protein
MQPSNAVIREGLARPEAALDQDDLGIEPIIINRLQYFGVGMPAEHRLALSSSPLQKATALGAPPLPANSAARWPRLFQPITCSYSDRTCTRFYGMTR